MIFVTVGTMFPFDRLIEAADEWAKDRPVESAGSIAQIGNGTYHPKNFKWQESLEAPNFNAAMKAADVIVAHAGMGSVISALRMSKPIVILPRLFSAGEHNTSHQEATARWLNEKPGVFVAWSENDLAQEIGNAFAARETLADIPQFADKAFTDKLHAAILRLRG